MIQVEHLSKFFGDVRAVNDISFYVGRGEVVGFLGPNGAGKSTTMRILTCFLPPTAGTAAIAGCSVVGDPMEARRHIGYLPETVPLYREMRVREYLSFRAKLKGVGSRERSKCIAQCLDQCGIVNMAGRIIGTLSKGYRQRVGLAEALLHDPDILILDEPTVGLDPNQIRLTRQVIKGLAEAHTILLSTHILPEVEMVCERFIIIDRGQIVAMDTMESLRRRSSTQVEVKGPASEIQQVLTDIAGVQKVACREGGEYHWFLVHADSDVDVRVAVYQALSTRGWALRQLHRERRSLEDLFVEATMREAAQAPVAPPSTVSDGEPVAAPGDGEGDTL